MDRALIDLRNLLASLYPDKEDAMRVVVDAGLPRQHIGPFDKPINGWHNILSEATKRNKIPSVIEVVLRDYPENPDLLRVARGTYAPVSPAVPTPEPRKIEFKHFPPERLQEIREALVAAGLASNRVLDSLTRDMNRQFVSMLEDQGTPLVRLVSALSEMNRVRRLSDGSVPMAQWLAAAEPLFAGRDEVQVIRQAMSELASGGMRSSDVQAHPAPAQFERTKDPNRTDMLPFGYLTNGARTGRSVARLQVPLYQNGKPALLPDGKPLQASGTAWLLTPDLILTNHHVVIVRDEGEPDPAEADLVLQAQHAVAQFDYVDPDAPSAGVPIKSLEAWSSKNGPLDYALLRLAEKQDPAVRTPLRLRRDPLQLPAEVEAYPSLNIIQHPLGGPKMVAFRNNQVVRVDGSDLWYYTDTQRGSSGSPVFDDEWRVVALHKRWTWATGLKYQGKSAAWVNLGTQIYAILGDLQSRYSGLWKEILAAGV